MTREEILKERAKYLAKPLLEESQKEDFIEVVVFKLAEEKYAIENRYAKEVYPLKDYTPLPMSPAFIFGLINVRRKILAVVDLKVFFGLPKDEESVKKVIILHEGEREFGILSDSVEGIQKIPINQLQTSLPTLTGIRQDFLKGITTNQIVVLDGKKLLTSKQIVVDEMVDV